MQNILDSIKEKICDGAKFNGTVYTKFNGKNWVTFYIYLDGVYTKICEVSKAQQSETKKSIESQLCVKSDIVPNTWLVDGKKVTNNLTYAEMYNKYGMDFE